MASMTETRCPVCGGKAYFHADDGITYCDEKNCGKFCLEDADYRPPDYRGGIPTRRHNVRN